MNASRRMIVGVSGATGVVYAIRILQALRALTIESHLVISKPGETVRISGLAQRV